MPEHERRPYAEAVCKDCQCSDCNTMTALAERRDAWAIANQLLTEAVKEWPMGSEGDPPSVDAADVLLCANWLMFGDTSLGG